MSANYTDEILGAVRLNESHRARSISIKISRADGSITLSYPYGYSRTKAIALLEQRREQILKIKEQQAHKRSLHTPASEFDMEQLIAEANSYLPQRIAQIAAQTKLRYNRVTLRATRSRWGSCSSENNISLSIYLMALPKPLIDFVIIHELCHTVHHNHSPKFHALVDHICQGREKELNRELREYSIR